MLYYSNGGADCVLGEPEIGAAVAAVAAHLTSKQRILVLPPDFSRLHSQACPLTCRVLQQFGDKIKAILPALGTHRPMTADEIATMFPGVPAALFRVHNWRAQLSRLGVLPAEYIRKISEGAVAFDWPAEISGEVVNPAYDLIISIGQVVPHEVAGMANYTKNIFVGVGGAEGINKSHFLGAAFGMERIMGKAENPVRTLFNTALKQFLPHLPVVYMLTVIGTDKQGRSYLRGLFVGDDDECYHRADPLSRQLNIFMLTKPVRKAVVYLNPGEYKSTWLGNKAIYRTRMALATGGELIIIAPGVREFGEDPVIDRLIRKYGYPGTPKILQLMHDNADLQENLGTTAHLIHGSTEGRFEVTYAAGGLSRQEVENAQYRFGNAAALLKRYDSAKLTEGYNTLPDGEEIYYISNPATGLWEYKNQEVL